MSKVIVAAVTSIAVALAGCQVSTSPKTVSRMGERTAPSMMTAPWDGQYTLYSVRSGNTLNRTIVQTAHLRRGEPLGFRVRENGVVAVAATLEVAVADNTYEWVMTPDAGQTDPVATGVLATILIVTVVVVAGLVIAVAVEIHNHPIFGK